MPDGKWYRNWKPGRPAREIQVPAVPYDETNDHSSRERGAADEGLSPTGRARATPDYAGLRSQVFALCLLTPTRRAHIRSLGASNSFIWKGLSGAQGRN
jgi:hypothetical protein